MIELVVRALVVILTAVLAAGPTLGVVCESLCPAHAREGTATDVSPVHETTPAHHHAPSAVHSATAIAQLDAAGGACCGNPTSADATVTTARTGSTWQALAIAAAHRVPAITARIDPALARFRAGPQLTHASHSPISPALRI